MDDRPPASADDRALLPSRIGPYAVDSMIGKGGMGIVYRATSPEGCPVAVKTLRYASVKSHRFAREASIRIDHPNVIQVLGSGTDELDVPYIVFELLVGESLEERLARGPLAPAEVLRVARQACEGLIAVHAAGIVHRDLKPANVFCCADGTVKLLDFGIARIGVGPRLTTEGTLLGSVSYLSPEQARSGVGIDERTDVWAIGALMYEALTGVRPFDRESTVATVLAVLQADPVPLGARVGGVSESVCAVVDRCLRKAPADRYPSAAELANALAQVTLDGPPRSESRLAVKASLPPDEERVVAILLARDVEDATRVEDAIAQLGGEPIRFLGDGVVGVFGGKSWEGDELARAVDAALACRPQAAAVAVGSGRARGEVTGISGAAVVAAERGAAQRLAGVAVDASTARALGRAYDAVRVAGDVFEITRRTPSSRAPAPDDSSPMLGREAELARMHDALRSTLETRRAHAVEVTGPLGIGKSRLRRELETMLDAAGEPIRVLVARGEPLYEESALHLWASLLRRQVRSVTGEGLLDREMLDAFVREVASDDASADLNALFLGELLGIPVDARPELDEARADAQLMADRLRLAVLDHVVGLARRGPLALILEDLHWADRASLELLERIVGSVADLPVLIFVSSRRVVIDPDFGEWTAVRFDRIALDGLAPALSARLAERVVRARLPEAVLDRLVAQTEGNPFFVEQAALALLEGGSGEGADRPLPPTVEAAVQSRLDHLPERARDLVKRASVLGRPFVAEELLALGATDVDSSLELLLHREILSPVPGSEDGAEIAFRSQLMADVTYRLLAREVREQLHARAARFLETARGVDLEEAASHYEKAGERETAARCYAEAAAAAGRRADSDSVLRCTERALALGLAPSKLHDVHMARADALRFLGRRPEQGQHLEAALQHASSDLERARALAEQVSWLRATGKLEEADRVGDRAVEVARASGDAEALATALCRQADALVLAGRHADAETLVREAAHVVRDQTPRVRAFVDERRALLAHARGDLGQSVLAYARVTEQYQTTGSLRRAAAMQQNLADCYNRLGAYGDAENALLEALRACRRVGHRWVEPYVLTNLGYAQAHLGRSDDALRSLEEARQLATTTQDPRIALYAAVYRGWALLGAGRAEEASAQADAAAAKARESHHPTLEAIALTCAARARLLLGDATEALRRAERALEVRDALGSLEEDEGQVFLTLADALDATGQPADASRVRQRGAERIRAVASRIRDPAWRDRFLLSVPGNRELVSPTA